MYIYIIYISRIDARGEVGGARGMYIYSYININMYVMYVYLSIYICICIYI